MHFLYQTEIENKMRKQGSHTQKLAELLMAQTEPDILSEFPRGFIREGSKKRDDI